MNVEKLKERAEDIQSIENEQIQGTEETSIEQNEEMNKFMLELTKNRFKSVLKALKIRMDKGVTLEEIIQEIKEKRSSLPHKRAVWYRRAYAYNKGKKLYK